MPSNGKYSIIHIVQIFRVRVSDVCSTFVMKHVRCVYGCLSVCVFHVHTYVSGLLVSIDNYGRKMGKSVKILHDVPAWARVSHQIDGTGMIWCSVVLCCVGQCNNTSKS